jgi:hypothetical protein
LGLPFRPRLRALALALPRWLLLLVGLDVLARTALRAMGGYDRLWLFERMNQSRYTAMAILTGTLRLRNGLQHVGGDEQVYNGAGYTNWGFGVPLLETPFHLYAWRHIAQYPSKFFPDRAIFFFYLLVLIPVLWAAFDRLLAMRERAFAPGAARVRRHLLSWSATLFVLGCTLYPLMSCRFLIYEETIAYMVVFELFALSAYIFAQPAWGSAAVAMLGAAAGVGLVVRSIGLLYLGLWGMLVLLQSRRAKPVLVYAAVAAPFLVFWLYSNTVRSGSPFALGYSNSLPGYAYHLAVVRFGNRCGDTKDHFFEAAWRLFRGLFLNVNDPPGPLPPLPSAHPVHPPPTPEPSLWLKQCHFDFELRPPAGQVYDLEPLLGTGVLLLLGWILAHYLARRERRLSLYLPFATFAVLFCAYAKGVPGLAWRYEGDFWPFVVIACAQYANWLPRGAARTVGLPLALVFALWAYTSLVRDVDPALATLEMIDPNDPATPRTAMWDDFTNSRYSLDPPLPSSVRCGDRLGWPFRNGQGWSSSWGGPGCTVDPATMVYLGVPRKRDGRYALRFNTRGVRSSELRVNVNGRIYTAHRSAGDEFSVPVDIKYEALTSPIVMTTIEWTTAFDPPPGVELLSIELT